ncbi:MAG: IS5/IS1182 family transposase, partial [Cardiobacteriaceae bacterium]|nr:IS5/IS1182 family transposase [Cardiobacteriaceae bacterium]
MSSFFQQTAQAMINRHIDRFPLLKIDRIIDWQPILLHLHQRKTHQ